MSRFDFSAARREAKFAARLRARRHASLWNAARLAVGLVLFGSSFLAISSASAQGLAGAGSSQSTADSTSGRDSSAMAFGQRSGSSADRDDLIQNRNLQPGAALSADQISRILEQNPELASELKQQLADRLRQQGVDGSAGDISDEMLYRQIASSADLRSSITTVLQARGYVSNEDLISSGLGGNAQPEQNAQLSGGDQSGEPSLGANVLSKGPATQGGIQNTSQSDEVRRDAGHASTDEPVVVHAAVPYDLQSARDLYTQIPDQSDTLKRFGSDVFVHRKLSAMGRGTSSRDTALDVPLGPDYVLGPGDKLSIRLWGGTTQTIARTVDRDGTVFLPEAGSLQIAGLTLGKAQTLIEEELKKQFRNAQVSVVVSELRSVRVYVVGDVQRPGGYDLSALATPISALYAAGGPTAVGSLRMLKHLRGDKTVEDVDLYDFLLHGIRAAVARFESGDTLLVPPAGRLVAVGGAVRRPAIYELKAGENTLAKVIEDAGGLTAAASLGNVVVERIDGDHQRKTISLREAHQSNTSLEDLAASFEVRDGDKVKVDPILPFSKQVVYLSGHVVRPGRVGYSEGMKLSDVLRSYEEILPEPAAHGEIVRLMPPDLHPETIDFSLPDVLIGNGNVELRPFDTVRVFGRYEVDAPTVSIRGEVLRPGNYPMTDGMSAAKLVRAAGGFKRNALQERADLTSYEIQDGKQISQHLATVRIGAAVSGRDPQADVSLKPGDILTVHQISNWDDIGQSVTVRGQVLYPGSYGFREGERLSSVLLRAGGLLPTAYPAGAVLIRDQVKNLEQTSRDELVRQIEANAAAARLSPGVSSANGAGVLQLIREQQTQIVSDLKGHPPVGRMVIHISADVQSWANTPADIELRRGDVLTIPKQPGFVLVSGQVYNATALTFTPGKSAGWYLSRAGGANSTANRKEIFIIRANGTVVGRRSGGWFEGDVLSAKLNPGDVIVVPQKIIGGSLFWRNLLSAGQLAASVAITSGVALAAL
ncbi:MAG: SLBB domain-containing protein [Acidobacteria bacterium]|nr:SLBB domain-containing protein [Acidobacteriota bacterium]